MVVTDVRGYTSATWGRTSTSAAGEGRRCSMEWPLSVVVWERRSLFGEYGGFVAVSEFKVT